MAADMHVGLYVYVMGHSISKRKCAGSLYAFGDAPKPLRFLSASAAMVLRFLNSVRPVALHN
jgi:hypothetical protein